MSMSNISLTVYFSLLLIGLIVFAIIWWLTKKYTGQESKATRAMPWIGFCLFTPMAFAGFLLIWLWFLSYYPKEDFDQTKWKEQPGQRYQLVDDLIDSEKLIGKSKSEVVDLLGQRHHIDYDENHWFYHIGFVPGQGIAASPFLEIYFKKEAVVEVSWEFTSIQESD